MEAPTFIGGVHAIMNCNVTEFPDTINTLKRFNLYPEVSNVRLYLDPEFPLLRTYSNRVLSVMPKILEIWVRIQMERPILVPVPTGISWTTPGWR